MTRTGWMPPILKGFLNYKEERSFDPAVAKYGNANNAYYLNGSTEVEFGGDWGDIQTWEISDVRSLGEVRSISYTWHGPSWDILIVFFDADENILSYHPLEPSSIIPINSKVAKIRFPNTIVVAGLMSLTVQVMDSHATEITDDVMNWDQLDMKLERDRFTGTFLDTEQALQLTGESYDLLHNIFMSDGLYADAVFEVHRRDNFDLNKYTVVHAMQLNFATYAENEDYLEVSGESRNFNTMLASFGNTKYDFPVAEVIDEYWKYEHNEMINVGNWTMPEGRTASWTTPEQTTRHLSLLINLDKAEMVPNGVENDMKTQNMSTGNNDEYFFKCAGDVDIRVSFSFREYMRPPTIPTVEYFTTIALGRIKVDGTVEVEELWDGLGYHEISFDKILSLKAGEALVLYASVYNTTDYSIGARVEIIRFDHFTISYKDKTSLSEQWAVVSPETMANYLLYRMSESGFARYTAEVEWKDKPFDTYLCAAETIRGYGEEAYFHASLNDFIDFMQFLGYEWSVDEDTKIMSFGERDKYFNPQETALQLNENEMAGLVMKSDEEYAFSTLKIGYERPDIENTNGKYAPHGAYDYTSGYPCNDSSESTLEIICPYKPDPVEIEVLSWSRAKKTTDTKADNDIFFVALNKSANSDGTFTEFRDYQYVVKVEGTDISMKLFNAPFNPRFIVSDNESLLGINAHNLQFEGTDAFRGATFDKPPYDPYGNITIAKKLFDPVIYEFAAGAHLNLPNGNARNGLVKFMWRGRLYKGYIKELVKNYCIDQETTWTLYAVK